MDSNIVLLERKNKIIYREGDKLVKRFNEQFSTAEVLNEAFLLSSVSELGLNVPEVLEIRRYGRCWELVMEYIEGKTFQQLMDENPSDYTKLLKEFVKIQVNIHKKNAPKLPKLADKLNLKISETEFTATQRYDLHTRIDDMPKDKHLLHGDFTPGNVILKPNGRICILDWSHCSQGDICGDCAATYLRYILAGNTDQGKEYVRLFCEMSHVMPSVVTEWLPVVAAGRLVRQKSDFKKETLLKIVDIDNKGTNNEYTAI